MNYLQADRRQAASEKNEQTMREKWNKRGKYFLSELGVALSGLELRIITTRLKVAGAVVG